MKHILQKTFKSLNTNTLIFMFSFAFLSLHAVDSDNILIKQYIESRGKNIVSFDSSNIKQFWIDHSVISNNKSFQVLLTNTMTSGFKSTPLKVQFANINETMDCKVEVIADAKDFVFSVLNNKSKVISTSSPEDDFLRYKVATSVSHLEDTTDLSFYIQFQSNTSDTLDIQAIVFSFSNNPNSSFLVSPGNLTFSRKDVFLRDLTGKVFDNDNDSESNEDDHVFSVTGKWFGVLSEKKILLSDKPVSNSVTLKNIGDKPTSVYLGYAPYTKTGQNIHNRNNPYKKINKVMIVKSFDANSNKIIVDSYPEWEKGCCLVLNAKEDLSDFPNFSFVSGSIVEVKQIDEDNTEILFDKPIQNAIKSGDKVRVQSKEGDTYIYTNIIKLNPGEEATISSTIQKDDSFLQYSKKAFSKGTYYIVPLIYLFSTDEPKDTTVSVLISNFTVSY